MKTLNDMTLEEINEVRQGAFAASDGEAATACPHTPANECLMNAWLQGFVTETDEPGLVNHLIFGTPREVA